MDNQHRKIKGYRELSEAEIAVMNKVKEHGAQLEMLLQELGDLSGDAKVDPRWLAIGKTHLQEGLMALTRSVAKPSFF